MIMFVPDGLGNTMLRFQFLAITTALATFGIALGVRADTTIVAAATFNWPYMTKSYSPQLHETLRHSGQDVFSGQPMVIKLSIKGTKSRMDVGSQIILVDRQKKKYTTLDMNSHTYIVRPEISGSSSRAGIDILHDTGQTKIILGHIAHHYVIKSAGAARNISSVTDIWVALDLPQFPELAAVSGPAPMVNTLWKRLPGTPLLIVLKAKQAQYGEMTYRWEVKAVSQKKLPATLFKIPKNYKLTSLSGMPGGRVRQAK